MREVWAGENVEKDGNQEKKEGKTGIRKMSNMELFITYSKLRQAVCS